MLELARAHVDPAYQPHRDPDAAPYASIYVGGIGAGTYLEGVDRYGSFTFSLDELRAQEELVRQGADATLAGALSLHLEPADSSKPATTCREAAPAAPGAPVFLELPRGGAVLRSDAEAPVKVQLARFAGLGAVPVGTLPRGGFAELRIPADAAPEPWRAALASKEPVTVCELPDAAGGALGGSGPP